MVKDYCGDRKQYGGMGKGCGKDLKADLVRLYLTSTRQRNFSDISSVGKTVGTSLVNSPPVDH